MNKVASLGLRFGLGIITLIVLFFAREDPALADLYVEVMFWMAAISTVLLGIGLFAFAVTGDDK
jgi:hypothetical protein